MCVQQISCIVVLVGIFAQVNGWTNIPNTYHGHNNVLAAPDIYHRHNNILAAPNMYHRHNIVSDPRVETLHHRIATLQKTLKEIQKQRLHSRPRPLAPQPTPSAQRVHHHAPVHSQPLNYHMVRSPFTSDLLDRISPRSFGPEAPFEYYTTFVPESPFYE